MSERYYKHNKEFINQINTNQDSWVAGPYAEYEQMTLGDLRRRAGGLRSHRAKVSATKPSLVSKIQSRFLPESWDWRNVSGVNYVSPVRNQQACGSCYAFASMAALESRVRILTRNMEQPVFSTQDIVDCSSLSQGCDGGFGYLIAGRYGKDYGVVLEECNPYRENGRSDGTCRTDKSCLRHYTANYRYVGGYFGGCNEEEMKRALYRGGPLVIAFEVHSDFKQYHSGIYEYTGLEDKYNPLEETNHAVLLVGYGVEEKTKKKYWIVKNSWGTSFGEDGFFKIVRGTDNCSIESMALEVIPIPY